jgi:anti-sigma factor (TIGR02949 family)
MSECRRVGALLAPMLDNELDAGSRALVEDHLAACVVCSERKRFELSLRASLQQAVRVEAPKDLRSRVMHRMQAERAMFAENVAKGAHKNELSATDSASSIASVEGAPVSSQPAVSVVGSAAVIPLPVAAKNSRGARAVSARMMWVAAAASVLLAFGGRHALQAKSKQSNASYTRGTSLQMPGALGDILVEHERPLPPESKNAEDVRKFGSLVGVPVNPEALKTGRLVGGRVLPVNRERAAMLQYEVSKDSGPSRRVSVFIYDPKKIQIERADLEPRGVGTAQVHVGRANGYSLAVTEREGVGMVMAADMDPESSAELLQ